MLTLSLTPGHGFAVTETKLLRKLTPPNPKDKPAVDKFSTEMLAEIFAAMTPEGNGVKVARAYSTAFGIHVPHLDTTNPHDVVVNLIQRDIYYNIDTVEL